MCKNIFKIAAIVFFRERWFVRLVWFFILQAKPEKNEKKRKSATKADDSEDPVMSSIKQVNIFLYCLNLV